MKCVTNTSLIITFTWYFSCAGWQRLFKNIIYCPIIIESISICSTNVVTWGTFSMSVCLVNLLHLAFRHSNNYNACPRQSMISLNCYSYLISYLMMFNTMAALIDKGDVTIRTIFNYRVYDDLQSFTNEAFYFYQNHSQWHL